MTLSPAIVVVAAEHADPLVEEFRSRYARDYVIEIAGGAAEASMLLQRLVAQEVPVAMVAAEARLPDGDAVDLLRTVHTIVPTARRVCLLGVDDFRTKLARMRDALAQRVFDTFLLIPQGRRDEEFHTAIIELLSDWGWSVAPPLVAAVDIVTDRDTPAVAAIRDLLDRMGIPNLTRSPTSAVGAEIIAQAREGTAGPGPGLPVVRALGRALLVQPSPAEVAESIYGTPDQIPDGTVADLVVVGAGPAGLAAAVYGASEGLSTIVVEAGAIGGQAGTSSMIRNYLGFPRGISGMRLAQRARIQASRFGARFFTGRPVESVERAGDHLHVHVRGARVCARSVVVATGVTYRRLGVESIEDRLGVGVFYGAATSAAREMSGRDVVVVGGGNSAGQAAVHLARFARSVTVVVRRPDLSATMSDYLVREIAATPRITVVGRTEVVDGGGDGRLEWVTLQEHGGRVRRVDVGGLFLLLGADPTAQWLPDEVVRDGPGFVLTGRDVPRSAWTGGRPPAPLETTLPGVFAVGDVRAGSMKRVASASGEGASAIPLVHAHLEWLRAQQFASSH